MTHTQFEHKSTFHRHNNDNNESKRLNSVVIVGSYNLTEQYHQRIVHSKNDIKKRSAIKTCRTIVLFYLNILFY